MSLKEVKGSACKTFRRTWMGEVPRVPDISMHNGKLLEDSY